MPHQCTNCGNTFPDGSKEMLSGCPECGGNKFQFEPSGKSKSESKSERSTSRSQKSQSRSQSSTTHTRSTGTSTRSTTDADDSDPLASRSWPGESDDTDDSTSRATDPTQATDRSSTTDNSSTTDSTSTADSTTGIDATDDGFVSSDPEPASGRNTTPDRPGSRSGRDPHADVEMETDEEDTAQADARTEMVSGSELPDETRGDRTQSPADGAQSPAERGSVADSGAVDGTDATAEEEEAEADFEELREELNDQFESIRIVRPGQYELNLMELYDREEYIISLREDGRYVIEMPEAWDDPDDPDQ